MQELNMNQLATAQNRFQRNVKKVLCCCSAGLLRAPTAAHLLSSFPYMFNTRACGVADEYALIPLTPALIYWADEIIVMDEAQHNAVVEQMSKLRPLIDVGASQGNIERTIHTLNIPDRFAYRDEELVDILVRKFGQLYGHLALPEPDEDAPESGA